VRPVDGEGRQQVRFAYADPPYPGQSAALYGNHPDYAGEVDHAELIGRLERDYPDGWALSTSAQALPVVLRLCPLTARVAAWHKSNSSPIRTTRDWIWTWEPVIVAGGRPGHRVRDALSSAVPARSSKRIVGQKPEIFSRWVLELLGAEPGDQVDDLFAGSGAVQQVLDNWQRQPTLSFGPETFDGEFPRLRPAKASRRFGEKVTYGRAWLCSRRRAYPSGSVADAAADGSVAQGLEGARSLGCVKQA